MQSLNLPNDFLRIKEEDYHSAIAKFSMTDRMVQESMDSIRDWYDMQPHLPEGALTNDRLFRHLLAVGFSLEKVKEKIDNLLTARSIIPELMIGRDPGAPWALQYREYATCALIPQRLDDMSRVMIWTFNDKDASDMNMWDHFKFCFMLCDYRLCADISVGEHYIVDFKGIKLSHVIKITPTMIKKVLFIIQSCFGAKVKGIHYTNVPAYAESVVSLIKAGLSKKIAARVFTYKDYEGIYENIPRNILPAEFGGLNKPMLELQEDTLKELLRPEWREWFENEDQFTTDESRRLGFISDMSNELLGIHGSFRRLDLDYGVGKTGQSPCRVRRMLNAASVGTDVKRSLLEVEDDHLVLAVILYAAKEINGFSDSDAPLTRIPGPQDHYLLMPPKGYVDRMLDVNEVDLCEVYKKFNFTEKMVKECLEHIRDWYLKQPHLPEQAWDADRVLRFLFMSKFSVENTKSRLDRMLTARADVPEFLADRDPLSPDMLMFQNCVEFAVLPKMVGDGRVTMVRFLKDFPEDLEPSLIIKFALMVADYRLMYDVALAEHMVIDLNHLKIAYFSRFTPTLAKKANYILQSCLGAKVGGIYLVNVPAYADMTINMFKIVLKKKIADRIKIYKSYEDLKKVFPTDILPSDLGGQEKSISEITADVYAALRSPEWRKWFLNEGAMKSDESKRQTEKTNFDVELGVHGCFRKLDVD